MFDKLKNQPVTSVKPGYGSFITIGFGKDISFETIIRGKKDIEKRPEWSLWVYMCFWELEINGVTLISSEDDREEIQQKIPCLLNKKLFNFEILSSNCDMKLHFEDNITLSLLANNDNDDNEQWLLYTPEQKVLVAGPLDKLSYEDSSQIL